MSHLIFQTTLVIISISHLKKLRPIKLKQLMKSYATSYMHNLEAGFCHNYLDNLFIDLFVSLFIASSLPYLSCYMLSFPKPVTTFHSILDHHLFGLPFLTSYGVPLGAQRFLHRDFLKSIKGVESPEIETVLADGLQCSHHS